MSNAAHVRRGCQPAVSFWWISCGQVRLCWFVVGECGVFSAVPAPLSKREVPCGAPGKRPATPSPGAARLLPCGLSMNRVLTRSGARCTGSRAVTRVVISRATWSPRDNSSHIPALNPTSLSFVSFCIQLLSFLCNITMHFSTVTPAVLAFAGFVAAHPSGPPSHPTGHPHHPHPPPGQDDCKCFPGDDCWPTSCEWSGLNATIDGRLIATVPLATPCHGDAYDADECATLQDEWLYSAVQ